MIINKFYRFFEIVAKNRIYGLDILRCLAILFVMLEHGELLLYDKINNIQTWFIFDGVSIFFVLSGFLIGGILIKILETEKINYKTLADFWARRWLRTLPNYILVLLLLIFLSFSFTNEFDPKGSVKYFLFLQNFDTIHPYFFPEAWSLSIEEWFYLLIPPVLFLLAKLSSFSTKNSVLLTIVVIIISVLAFRSFRFWNITVNSFKEWDDIFRKQVITRLDSIMFGLIGAYISHYYRTLWIKYKGILFVAGILIFIISKITSNFNPTGAYACILSFTVTSIATLLLLPYFSELKKGKGLIYNTVTFISLISYSMYLINLSIVQFWILKYMSFSELSTYPLLFLAIRYLLFWIFTIIGSVILYKFIERPFMNLRTKLPQAHEKYIAS